MGSEVLSLPAGFLVESFSSISHGSESLQKISESFHAFAGRRIWTLPAFYAILICRRLGKYNKGEETHMASRYESDMTRKEKMQLEKEKLSKMNFKEKLAYIWEYYKAVIFGIIAVIFIIGTIVNIHENAKYYDLVSIAVVDYAGLQDVSPIEEDLKEALGTGDKYEKVSIDTSYSFGENLENADYNTLMKFTAVIAAQSMDVLICSQAVYDNYSKDDYFLDLSTLFDEATCEKYGIKAGDTCLDISKLKKYQDMGLTYYEPCYLTVVVNSKNTDNATKLIEYLEEDGVNE